MRGCGVATPRRRAYLQSQRLSVLSPLRRSHFLPDGPTGSVSASSYSTIRVPVSPTTRSSCLPDRPEKRTESTLIFIKPESLRFTKHSRAERRIKDEGQRDPPSGKLDGRAAAQTSQSSSFNLLRSGRSRRGLFSYLYFVYRRLRAPLRKRGIVHTCKIISQLYFAN